MAFRVLIVDDEQPAREELAYMLGEIPDVDVIGEADCGMEAVKKTKELTPDFVFLDIRLPDLTGLQVAEIINEFHLPVQIVFLTAYDEFAIDAFKLHAFHYILKPYDLEDLMQMFDSYFERRGSLAVAPTAHKLAIQNQKGIIYLTPKEIYFIEKRGRMVDIHTKTETFEAGYTLNELFEKLKPHSFYRTHKSFLVNLEHVKELHAWMNGSYNVVMCDDAKSQVPVSRNYVRELRLRIEL
jgi:DNA-binding LytR/AlgR family response regulator